MTEYTKNIVDQMPLMLPVDLWAIIEAAQAQLKAYQEIETDLKENKELEDELFRRIKEYENGNVEGRPWREAIADIRQRLKAS